MTGRPKLQILISIEIGKKLGKFGQCYKKVQEEKNER